MPSKPYVSDIAAAPPRVSPLRAWREGLRSSPFLYRFRQHVAAQVGMVLLVTLIVVGLFAPWIAPHDPNEVDMRGRLQFVSWEHAFGTDQLGRDLFSRVIYGARISVVIGVVSVGVAMLLGLPPGIVAGYFGGPVDKAVSALLDFLLSFPPLLLAILVIAIFGPGLFNAMVAIGISQVPIFARLMRAEFLRVRSEDFVQAANAIGAPPLRVILRHVLPNALSPIVVQATLSLATAILSASYLGFLGLGAQPPMAEWGAMLNDGRRFLRAAPHVSVFPGLAIVFTMLAFNLFGDGLRDAMDPKSRR